MKVIIAGSRSITNFKLVSEILDANYSYISEVVCDGARGVDNLGKLWAENNNIPIRLFPADWNTFGKSAGYKRNVEMAKYADALILIWDGVSKGSNHMLNIATEYKLRKRVYTLNTTYKNPLEKQLDGL